MVFYTVFVLRIDSLHFTSVLAVASFVLYLYIDLVSHCDMSLLFFIFSVVSLFYVNFFLASSLIFCVNRICLLVIWCCLVSVILMLMSLLLWYLSPAFVKFLLGCRFVPLGCFKFLWKSLLVKVFWFVACNTFYIYLFTNLSGNILYWLPHLRTLSTNFGFCLFVSFFSRSFLKCAK